MQCQAKRCRRAEISLLRRGASWPRVGTKEGRRVEEKKRKGRVNQQRSHARRQATTFAETTRRFFRAFHLLPRSPMKYFPSLTHFHFLDEVTSPCGTQLISLQATRGDAKRRALLFLLLFHGVAYRIFLFFSFVTFSLPFLVLRNPNPGF